MSGFEPISREAGAKMLADYVQSLGKLKADQAMELSRRMQFQISATQLSNMTTGNQALTQEVARFLRLRRLKTRINSSFGGKAHFRVSGYVPMDVEVVDD